MTIVAAPALRERGGRRSPTSRCKRLLLGPPLATSLLVRERLRKVVALNGLPGVNVAVVHPPAATA
ncbi:MAG TPA: hypothetical protein VGR74_07960 [Actinomycetota bacterium]|jgi:hypothetical protein|nr:hypothetical protein [Actinomycetota bacterium]